MIQMVNTCIRSYIKYFSNTTLIFAMYFINEVVKK